jgi:hypothetical protein
MAVTQVNGQPVLVSGDVDKTVRIWDLQARARS